jgi:hypothetical protein
MATKLSSSVSYRSCSCVNNQQHSHIEQAMILDEFHQSLSIGIVCPMKTFSRAAALNIEKTETLASVRIFISSNNEMQQ